MSVDSTNGSGKKPSSSSSNAEEIPAESRETLIARLAYLKAKERGFVAGHAWDDWLAAEREIDAQKK
jgi:hypothetical protein